MTVNFNCQFTQLKMLLLQFDEFFGEITLVKIQYKNQQSNTVRFPGKNI